MNRSCGTCSNWMLTSTCPRERRCADGFHRGPSINGTACGSYRPDLVILAVIEQREREETERAAAMRAKEEIVLHELLSMFVR